MTEAAVCPTGIRVGIVYNTFKPEEVEFHTLPYTPGATIRDYVGDLADGTWSVGYRGEAYNPGDWDTLTPGDGEAFSFVQVPEGGGGGGGKDILRMVAMIAVMVVAYAVVGPWALGLNSAFTTAAGAATTAGMVASGVAMGTFAMAGMMVVNALIPPAMPTQKSGDGRTYGIDGPKNTAKEGITTPISYGKVRIGGNIVDSFTKLHGDTQYLYMRVILNDGKIKSASEFEINDEPLANYQNVETRVSLGDFEGQENDWFGEAIRMKSIGSELQTSWVARTTETEVDRLRIDLLYPEGLGYWKDDGKVLAAESEVAFEYRMVGDPAWQPLKAGHNYTFFGMSSGASAMPGYDEEPPAYAGGSYLLYLAMIQKGATGQPAVNGEFYGSLTPALENNPTTGIEEAVGIVPVPQGGGRITVTALAQVQAAAESSVGSYSMSVWYREIGTSAWNRFGGDAGVIERSRSGQDWATFPLVYRSYSTTIDPTKRYEVTTFGGTLTEAEVFISDLNSDGKVFLYRAKEESFRYSYESGILPRGKYEVRVRRTREKEDNRKRKDGVYWQDLAEIDVENIHYVGTANVSLKIKVDDQISGIPTFTSMIEASEVKQFDADGNLVADEWSPWPVWHVLDVLLNNDRGRGISTSRIDFASAKEWEAHCIKHNLQFNGTFDQKSNVWDTIQKICRVGHAQIVRSGTKYSFVVDKASDPVQLFNDANIIQGTFSTTWLPLSERANEIQYTFYPEEDGGKEKMLRVIDPDAQNSGAPLRVAKITELGVTNYDQARFNIEKQLRENKLIRKAVSFDAPIEAIGLTIGDVALIQHSSAHYGKGIGQGRLKVGSTRTRLMLDAPVLMDPAKTYKVLIVHPAVKRYTVNVENVIHNTAYVSGLPSGAMDKCTRLRQGDVDVRIDDIRDGNPLDRIIVSDGSVLVNGVAELWATDVIDEREVVYTAGEQEELTLAAPLASDPTTHATWMVGPVETVKAPYRLRQISGSDVYRRSLTFIEYNELVYAPMGTPITPPSVAPSQTPLHVLRPSISYPVIVDGQQTRVTARVSWEKADLLYAGADIYISRDGRPFSFQRSVADVTSFEMEMSLGEDVQVRIVAFGTNGRRANVKTAPVVATVVRPDAGDLDRPINLTVSLTSFKVDADLIAEWQSALPATFRVQYFDLKTLDQALFDAMRPEEQAVFDKEWGAREGWKTVGTTNETSMDIPRISEGKILVRVRAENGRSTSPYTYVKFDVTAPNLPAAVRNLRLNGSLTSTIFSGRDAHFSWDDILDPDRVAPPEEEAWSEFRWVDYEVLILDASGNLIRKEYTRNANYSYTFSKNAEDSVGERYTARRSFQIEVRIRDKAGRRSFPASKDATNPRPGLPNVSFRTGRNLIQASFTKSSDSDYEGTSFWYSETEAFEPNDSNMGWSGRIGPAEWITPKAVEYYVRYGAFDAFDSEDILLSSAIKVKPNSIFDGLDDDTDAGKDLGAFVGDRIDEILESRGDIDPAMLTDYIFNRAANETTQQAFTEFVGMVNDEPVGVFTKRRTEDLSFGLDYVVQDVSLIGARSEDGKAFLLDIDTVKVGPEETFANRLSNMTAQTEEAMGAITREEQARITAIDAEVSARTTMGIQFNETIGLYRDEVSLLADDLSFEAGRLTSLIGEVGDQKTLLIEETTQRIKDGEVFTNAFRLMGSINPSGDAFILNEATTQIGPRGSLSQVLEGINGQFEEISGDISAERTVRIKAEEAIVKSVDALSLKTDDLDGSITTVKELYDDLEGNVRARAAMSINYNGRLTGWELDGVTSSFNVAANHFGVSTEDASGAILNPFSILGNKINMTADVRIDGNLLVADTITTNRIKANNITIIDAASMAGTRVGNGSTQTAITYVINLAEPAKLLAWASGRQAYLAGNQPYAFDIAINGNVYPGVSGSGGPIDSVNAQAFANVPAGQHTVTCRWFGTNSQLSLANATMMVMAVFK